MLGVYYFALCLATVTSSAIYSKRPIGNGYKNHDHHPSVRHRAKVFANGRATVGSLETSPLSSRCNTKNSNGMCSQDGPGGGGTFLTDLEGTSLGPGFPPKPVGLLVRPNVSREEAPSTTPPSENRFLMDDTPPMPPPPLQRRPLPKGRLRRPLLNSGERQKEIEPIIVGPLFPEDVQNPEITTQGGDNRNEASPESGEQNRALFDSFNDLDYPDSKLLSELKGKWYPKYYADKRNSELKGKKELLRMNSKNEEEDESEERLKKENNSGEEEDNSNKSAEVAQVSVEEAPIEETSEDYQNSNDERNQYTSEEGHSSHSTEEDSNEEEESTIMYDPGNEENADENKHPTNGQNSEEENTENSEEVENRPSIPPHSEEQLGDPPLIEQRPNGSLEDSGQSMVSSKEEGSESQESTNGVEQNSTSEEALYSSEGSTEDRDYLEENNHVDSSPPSENSEKGSFHLTVVEEPSNESNESAQKPISASEETNEIPPTSVDSAEEADEDHNSREQHSQEHDSGEQQSQEYQSDESPEKPPNEYDEEDEDENPKRDYYDVPDYDNASPASDYDDVFPKSEEEINKNPLVYKKRPAAFYYMVGGSEEQEKVPNDNSDDDENDSKSTDYEDNKLKQSEEVDSSISSDEEHPSSGSNESFGSMGFDSFDLDSEMKLPGVKNNVKTTISPVAVMTSATPPTEANKCNNNDDKENENSEDQKILKKPIVTVKPSTLQPGDVVSFTRDRPVNFVPSPIPQTTPSTFRPASISAIGIIKPGGSIIAKVVSPTLYVHSPTGATPTRADSTQTDSVREATALTYLKPPPVAQTQTWFLGQARGRRFIDFFSRPL